LYISYNKASPTAPTAPTAHEAALMCDAAPGVGDEAAALPDAVGLLPSLDVPLGLPEIFCCEISMLVAFLQWLL
jgi:hypothetical protein